jgi:hypothetical protein
MKWYCFLGITNPNTQNFEIANLEEHPEQRGTSGTAFRFEGLLTVRRMKFSTMIVSN